METVFKCVEIGCLCILSVELVLVCVGLAIVVIELLKDFLGK